MVDEPHGETSHYYPAAFDSNGKDSLLYDSSNNFSNYLSAQGSTAGVHATPMMIQPHNLRVHLSHVPELSLEHQGFTGRSSEKKVVKSTLRVGY